MHIEISNQFIIKKLLFNNNLMLVNKYWFRSTTLRTSLSCGNQMGWTDNLIDGPPFF